MNTTANATNANVNAQAATMTEILVRFDANKGVPVVFIRDTIDAGNILAWTNGTDTVVPLAYYHNTQPMAAADEEIVRQRYAQAIGNEFVKVNHRLPRVSRAIPNRLDVAQVAQTPAATGGALVVNTAQPEPANVILTSAEQNAQAAPVNNVHELKSRGGRRKGSGRARPIESQPLPAAQTNAAPVAPPVTLDIAQATPADVMQMIQSMQADFAARLEQIMLRLTPAHQ